MSETVFVRWLLFDFENEKIEVDPFSKEYIFDEKYAEHRNKLRIGGPLNRRSYLSLLLREEMTEEHRKRIFDGLYDLGNKLTLPPALSTYEKLADELSKKRKEALDAHDAFDTIKKGIHRITGKKMDEHFKVNKSTALKVIKTLSQLMHDRKRSHLMQLLTAVPRPDKFSMSFRDAYPYEKSQEQVWLIADLKAYLSAELSDDRFYQIGHTFSSLVELTNNINRNTEKALIGAYGVNYLLLTSAYADLITTIKNYKIQHESKDLPLDEELFIHLHVLEFAHFAIGYEKLIQEAIPTSSITPVLEELRVFAKKAFPALFVEVRESDPRISISDIPAFSLHWQKEIIAIMEKAMSGSMPFDKRMIFDEFDQIKIDVQKLLRNFYSHQDISNGAVQGEMKVSTWYVIAAFCCVWHLQSPITPKEDKIFRPYWLGQDRQGGTLNASNKVPLRRVDRAPEEHRHISSNRLEWFANALRGHAELIEQRFAFRSVLLGKVLDICSTNNTDCIAQGLINFAEHVKGKVLMH